jgi:hypothetical protein
VSFNWAVKKVKKKKIIKERGIKNCYKSNFLPVGGAK